MRQPFGTRRNGGFTLLELMIVVLVIGIILSIAIPNWMRARESARTQTCVCNMTKIENAKDQHAVESRKSNGDVVAWADIVPAYMKYQPECPTDGDYNIQTIGTPTTCTVDGHEVP